MTNIDKGFNTLEEWMMEQIKPYGDSILNHYSIQEHKGFCPPYLGLQHLTTNKDGSGDIVQYIPFPIQQIKSEIYQFIDYLLKNHNISNVLEIGLGDFGGLHFLFNQFFNNTTTIEINTNLVDRFKNSINGYTIKNSNIICHDSKTILLNERYDLLFIDGDHHFDSCMNDHIKFMNNVDSGGVIAFHDSKNKDMGSAKYIDTLRDKYQIFDIWDMESEYGGISYYIQK
jgi:predicted O-methyltransferase YrrM